MDYISAKEAAEKWGITPRRVQQYCKDGLIPGAARLGRAWGIPRDAEIPGKMTPKDREETASGPKRIPMLLLTQSYSHGECLEYIRAIPDEDDRSIAMGEYYYFSGQAEMCTQIMVPYLDSPDLMLRYSACLLCAFANLSGGHINLARFAMKNVQQLLSQSLQKDSNPETLAVGIFAETATAVLLHLPHPEIPPLEDHLRYLPGGLRLWGCYILAHKAYLEGNYERALAFADISLAGCPFKFPISAIYLHLAAIMALMSMKRTDKARKHMEAAWELARQDGLIQPFVEHYGLLQGMVEVFFKNDYPEVYQRIVAEHRRFFTGWRKIHRPETRREVADNLTAVEFTIAMLANRGWTNKEISAHMGLTANTVKHYISIIYQKLGISNRNQLHKYMLR